MEAFLQNLRLGTRMLAKQNGSMHSSCQEVIPKC